MTRYQSKFSRGCGSAAAILLIILFLHPISLRAQALSDLDALRYIASHPDLIQAYGADANKGRSHYETWGKKEGRQTTFNPLNYTASHPDLIAAFGTDQVKATTHYIQWGYKEGRQTTFSPFAYIASYIDLIRAFGADAIAGAKHFIEYGLREGRRIVFDALTYINTYADLRAAFGTDTNAGAKHYIEWGVNERRTALAPTVVWTPQFGDVRELPAQDACDLKQRRPDVPNRGVFWFRSIQQQKLMPDLYQAPMRIDFPREGDCWTQMRRIPGVGGWYPSNDNLQGFDSLNTEFAITENSSVPWSYPFNTVYQYQNEAYFRFAQLTFLFATGDESAWCIIQIVNDERTEGGNPNDNIYIGTHKWRNQKYTATYSVGNGVVKGEATVTVNERLQTPTINCGGQVFYSESGDTEAVAFKNSRGGMNVYLNIQFPEGGGG
jgi:hypothetical protein